MRIFLLIATMIIGGCSTKPSKKSAETHPQEFIELIRYITTTTCYNTPKICVGPMVHEVDGAQVKLPLLETKSKEVIKAVDSFKIVDNGVTFSAKVVVRKNRTTNNYKISTMLKSGDDSSRKASLKSVSTSTINKFKIIKLSDKKVEIPGGYIQAQLIVKPKKLAK